jgi:hypothetical protein
MDHAAEQTRVGVACDGCGRHARVMREVDDARLCDGCVEKSARIDRQLATVASNDPVSCDGCDVGVDFDARVAVVVRECGGFVLCDRCKSVDRGEPS